MKELLDIQRELRVPKTRTNKFSNYKYRSCEDIFEAARPVCNAHDCILAITDEIEEHNGKLFIRSTAMITNTKGDSVSTTALAEIPASQAGMSPSQLTGSASSYARKYALCGLFCLDDSKDPDEGSKPVVTQKETLIDESVVKEIHDAKTPDDLFAIRDRHPEIKTVKAFKDMLNEKYNDLTNGNTSKD